MWSQLKLEIVELVPVPDTHEAHYTITDEQLHTHTEWKRESSKWIKFLKTDLLTK